MLIQEYCNTPAVRQLLDHSKRSSEHGQRGHSTSHQRAGAGEKLKVVSGHIRLVAAQGMKELSEMLVRRSDLELEPEEKRSARTTVRAWGWGAYPIMGNPETAYFIWKSRSRWQEPGQSSGTGLGQQAASLSEEAVAGLQQEQWLRPHTRPLQGPHRKRRCASGWRKKQRDSPSVSGGRGLDGERGKFTDPFPRCLNFSSPGET